ncbi:uncharacterized protein [Dysidea avara]|uniref:uncharacterized protein n=1 Tax=Dysidea avara TaxID=196820 RepID=UPI00332ACFC8
MATWLAGEFGEFGKHKSVISFCRKFVIVLISGQVLSLLVTGIGVFTTLLENHTGEDIPSTLTAGVFFLAITNGSMTIFVAALSILLIKKKYKLIHHISIIISTAGIVIVILEDLKTDTNKGNNPLVGDLICVAGGFGAAVAMLVKRF